MARARVGDVIMMHRLFVTICMAGIAVLDAAAPAHDSETRAATAVARS